MGRKQYFKLKNSFSSGEWAAAKVFVGGWGASPKKAPPPIKTKKGPHKRKGCKKTPICRKRPTIRRKGQKIVLFLLLFSRRWATAYSCPPLPALMLRCLTFKNVVRTRLNWKTKSMLLQIFIIAKMIAIML